MAAWTILVSVLALTWSGASADPRLAFPEDVRLGRIVSGWEASPGQIPYQLSLRMVNPTGQVNACGATLIHHEWALTAAHCTATRVTMVIRAGCVNLTRPALLFESTEYYNHPLYNEGLQSVVQPNDIGVIRLNQYVKYTNLVRAIRLQASADRYKDYSGDRLQASGWGRTWTLGSSPENLNWVYLTGVSNLACLQAFGGSSIIVESTICARHYNVTSQSTCQGDSGGPLVTIDYDGEVTQVGVTSFVSSTGCHTGFPAGFIRPGFYHEWLLEVTGVNFDWDRDETTTANPELTTTETTTDEAETTTDTTTDEPETTTDEEGTTTETTTEEGETTTEITTEAAEATTEAEQTTTTDTEEPESEEESEEESNSESDSESESESNSEDDDEDDEDNELTRKYGDMIRKHFAYSA